MKQDSFSDMEYNCWKKKRWEEFLEVMEKIIPWYVWIEIIKGTLSLRETWPTRQ